MTYDEFNDALPDDVRTGEQIHEILDLFSELDIEEVNRVSAGGNFGWDAKEGSFEHIPGGGVRLDRRRGHEEPGAAEEGRGVPGEQEHRGGQQKR